MQPHTRLDPCLLLLGILILQYMVDHGPCDGSMVVVAHNPLTTRAVCSTATLYLSHLVCAGHRAACGSCPPRSASRCRAATLLSTQASRFPFDSIGEYSCTTLVVDTHSDRASPARRLSLSFFHASAHASQTAVRLPTLSHLQSIEQSAKQICFRTRD